MRSLEDALFTMISSDEEEMNNEAYNLIVRLPTDVFETVLFGSRRIIFNANIMYEQITLLLENLFSRKLEQSDEELTKKFTTIANNLDINNLKLVVDILNIIHNSIRNPNTSILSIILFAEVFIQRLVNKFISLVMISHLAIFIALETGHIRTVEKLFLVAKVPASLHPDSREEFLDAVRHFEQFSSVEEREKNRRMSRVMKMIETFYSV
jgi:hypothetical protein